MTKTAEDMVPLSLPSTVLAEGGARWKIPLSLTLPNIWVNMKGKYSPGISPGISPGMCLLQDPRVMTFTLNFSEGLCYPNIFLG